MKKIERWMNEYPRKILECFYEELLRISTDIKVVEELVIGCHNCASQCG
ncbi:hypothetical protein JOD02_001734 [Caldicoprobacter guelmensis]|nr:hypothetical protein [Caldicoprobacter guelmensis]